jgi:hypothetical protein
MHIGAADQAVSDARVHFADGDTLPEDIDNYR